MACCFQVKDEAQALRYAMLNAKKRDEMCWLDKYRIIAECDGEDTTQLDALGLNFDAMVEYATSFYTLTPIADPIYTARLTERLIRSGMRLDLSRIFRTGAPLDSLEVCEHSIDATKLRTTYFVHCTCNVYTHYLWCIHSCGYAHILKLITAFPKTLNPRPIGVAKQGKARRGGALGR